MREILFRGKPLYEKYWITGSLYIVDGLTFIISPHERTLQVDVKTVGQYTGLKDKNGKWIFEGDILDVSGNHDAVLLGYRNGRAIVRWDEYVSGFEPFAYYDSDCGLYICEKECEVIGNIHDNPELIGGKEDGK